MAEQLQVLNLPLDFAHHVQALDLLPVENLDGHLVAGQLVEPDLDLAESADTEGLPEDVVANLDLFARNCFKSRLGYGCQHITEGSEEKVPVHQGCGSGAKAPFCQVGARAGSRSQTYVSGSGSNLK